MSTSNLPIANDIRMVAQIPVVTEILEVICRITGMGFAAVARVTDESWVACAVKDDINFGLTVGGELKLESTICHEIRHSGEPVVIDNVAEDPVFATHHTPLQYGFQSYISVPILLKDGSFFGTLCSIDPHPRTIRNSGTVGMFKVFASLIGQHLQTLREKEQAEARYIEEKRITSLREEFIAILGHDLRNPLQATLSGAQLLLSLPYDETVHKVAALIRNSSSRMNALIENMLDFARGRMGEGIILKKELESDPAAKLKEVIQEMKISFPGRIVEFHNSFYGTVSIDMRRIAQLLSNLLGNALAYGSPGHSIRVSISNPDNNFTLSVINYGEDIPSHIAARLFEPFVRGDGGRNQQGLGLGLYISLLIAKAHSGVLMAKSENQVTEFTLTVPL